MSKYIAIDLESSGLYVVAGTARSGTAKIEQALSWAAGADPGPPTLSQENARSLGEQLRDRLKAAGIPAAPVLVSVGRDRVILKEIRHPAVHAREEPALVRFQAMKEITDSPDDVVIDYVPQTGTTAEGEKRALAVVLRKDVLTAIQTMCTAAGFKLAGVTPRPFAVASGLLRAFHTASAPPPESLSESFAVLSVGASGGEYAVIREGEVCFSRAVPAPVLASEPQLTSEIRRNLAVFAGQDPSHPVKALYIAESGPIGWTSRLRAAVGIPVHPYDPLDGAAPDITGQARGHFAGAAGLLAARAGSVLPINFASPRQPRAEAHPLKQKVLLAALVAMLLIAAGAVFGWMQLQAANNRLVMLETRKVALQESVTRLEPLEKQYQAVEQWQSREVAWLDELYDMADRFPNGDRMRLTQFSGTAIQPDRAGKQEAQARLEMKLATSVPQQVDDLMTAIERDNKVGKKLLYVGTQKIAQQDVFTIITKVNRRLPNEYTRFPAFSPPNRNLLAAPPKDAPAQDPDYEP